MDINRIKYFIKSTIGINFIIFYKYFVYLCIKMKKKKRYSF